MLISKRLKISVFASLALALLISGCAGNNNQQTVKTKQGTMNNTVPIAANATPNAQKVIAAGSKYLGVPYEFGSNRHTTTTFDCSDFVRQAFWDGLKLKLPYDSRKQAAYVKQIGATNSNWRQLKPGDIMFFMSYRGSKPGNYKGLNKSTQRITHDGIYLGNGKMLHTYSKQSGGVKVENIPGTHWEYRFIFGGTAWK